MRQMALLPWIIEHWTRLVESIGIVAGLLFTGLGYFRDARVRRVETLIEITKQHRELWEYYYERPALAHLFDKGRNLASHPLTDEEVHFVNLLLNHLRVTFFARSAGVYIQPDYLANDVREFLSSPALLAAWENLKAAHEEKFVAFVERNRISTTR
jgi:hypothetical protein